jgi:hypothetical protein
VHFLYYGFYDDLDRSFFVVYGAENGQELFHENNILYVGLQRISSDGVILVEENLRSDEILHFFRNLENKTSIYSRAEFSDNCIHYFQDTLLAKESPIGVVSFYVGDTVNSDSFKKHALRRDSILTSLD